MPCAVLYCRVSSQKQVREGHGLSSQETTCRQYAREQGLTVTRVFTDDASGGGDFWKRPGICQLLAFLEEQEEKKYAVVFDDIKRFARDTVFHLKLRQELAVRNAYPLCPTFRFDDSPEGAFVETVIAATAELERKQNRRQVIRRMKARLQAGYWVFGPPLGYRYGKQRGQKILVPDAPVSDAVTEALEKYASGELPTQRSVGRFLQQQGCSRHSSTHRSVPAETIRRLLSNEIYSGWCVCTKWNLRVKGIHKALISEETHRRILSRLDHRKKTKGVKCLKKREEFPLRGFLRCTRCDRQVSSYWAKGRSKRYAYYGCPNPGCFTIRKEKMEDQFLDRLQQAVPSAGSVKLLETVLTDAFQNKQTLRDINRTGQRKEKVTIQKKIDTCLEALENASTPAVRQIYEERIETLQAELDRLATARSDEAQYTLEPLLTSGRAILQNPVRTWKNSDLSRRQIIQKLVFIPPIAYHRESGLRTARFSLLYRLIRQSEKGKSCLVDLVTSQINPVAEELHRWEIVLRGEKPAA